MKYSIEISEDGRCKEELYFNDEKLGEVRLVRGHCRTPNGSVCVDEEFSNSMELMGYSEEILDIVDECFDNMFPLSFMQLAEELSY